MRWKHIKQQTRLYFIGGLILMVGLGSALLIYLTAENESGYAAGYDLAGGNVYAIAPETSKVYVHNLELYGGKAAVLADEFNRWFNGLWHGTSLAFTVACVTILIFCGFLLVARQTASDSQSDVADKNSRIETD